MYLFKKIFSRLFFPVPLSLELIWVGLILVWLRPQRQMGKWILSGGVVIFTLLSFHPISNALLEPLESQYLPLKVQSPNAGESIVETRHVKWVVVLSGGGAERPGYPLASQLSSATVLRLVEGIALYQKLPGVKMLISGSTGEAVLMHQFVLTFGVPREDVVVESNSRDTKDQSRFIADIVEKEALVLVTEASHMPRSMALFRKQGLSPIAAPVGHRIGQSTEFQWWDLVPSAESLKVAERAFYEYLGLGWAALRGQI
ncbi:ElyC/SanA/YdcF family protein [Candidatus Nitronereus thalassa]|uniref:ElyC/SanA/YdcF family protein n=1 Tax=Candidatus Nitronereus thalassa TaxID=3020898 RepID=A0ABU3K6J6_9BACT|nr:ElyC/SanA/YdcF family protein [Candidatus Nitronereus thalassa]MDT7041996.1 ElyC/SanA/YdcF family protein [Candidatus Nitronereus thalassa]